MFGVDAVWDEDEGFNVWDQKVIEVEVEA